MEITPQRGAVAINLNRPRFLFFEMEATWLLIQKYGPNFLLELYTLSGAPGDKDREPVLKSMDALRFFLWAGLQADAKEHGEEFTLDDAKSFLRPFTWRGIFTLVTIAVSNGVQTPLGKTEAAQARPARPATKAPASPGPAKASTLLKRSAGPSASVAGRKRSSGARRSGS